jgi:hypothetical protein
MIESIPLDLLRTPKAKGPVGKPSPVSREDTKEKDAVRPETVILCRRCNQIISSSNEKISVNGSHRHTFANPHGLVFDIGCFQTVTGCGYAGPPSDEFSWFTGFSWRIVLCGMCLAHLGWVFLSGGSSFHGLILDRIVEKARE